MILVLDGERMGGWLLSGMEWEGLPCSTYRFNVDLIGWRLFYL